MAGSKVWTPRLTRDARVAPRVSAQPLAKLRGSISTDSVGESAAKAISRLSTSRTNAIGDNALGLPPPKAMRCTWPRPAKCLAIVRISVWSASI